MNLWAPVRGIMQPARTWHTARESEINLNGRGDASLGRAALEKSASYRYQVLVALLSGTMSETLIPPTCDQALPSMKGEAKLPFPAQDPERCGANLRTGACWAWKVGENS